MLELMVTELEKKSKSKSKPKPKRLTDIEVISLILETGNTSHFGELYDRYSNKVFRKCCSMVGNDADAQDLTQSILLKAFLHISKFEGRSSFSTWIYAITYNTCINFLKNKKRRSYITDEFDNKHDISADDENEIESKKLFEIDIEHLKQLLNEIKPSDKMLLLMKYQDNMSIEDIAEELELSNSAVKMRLLRARGRIRTLRKQESEKHN